ncbi:MAG: biotin--[acetyl-CoA-carboxylase] ligase [Nitrosopumilus sp. B06]|nr:MAG: biotin--[acetyl-CoA-carboxylase] ligase [Nitrosopumilus sp. D6]RNJ79376.1 MAG: biotin--[acetyl-CoA-carboxylase] ligase [Nitrosopumilus sp. B06]
MYSSEESGLLRVLRFLQSHSTEYLSGQDLSDVMRMSRVAVWKHIKKIQELGYTVESSQKLGYRLAGNTDRPYPWEVTAGLQTRFVGQKAYYMDIAESTQDEARKLAAPDMDGAVIIAAEQTGGRGRSAKRWVSMRGGIWLSVVLYPKFDVSVMTLFPVAVSLALSVAVEKALGVHPELRWPNDVTINGKKVAGILVDASLESNRIGSMIVGAGINYNVDASIIEEKLEGVPGFYGAASLDSDSKPVVLVQAFLRELEQIYDELHDNNTDHIVSEWSKRSSTIGSKVRVDTQSGIVSGIASRIDGDGALVVGGTRVAAGDLI